MSFLLFVKQVAQSGKLASFSVDDLTALWTVFEDATKNGALSQDDEATLGIAIEKALVALGAR